MTEVSYITEAFDIRERNKIEQGNITAINTMAMKGKTRNEMQKQHEKNKRTRDNNNILAMYKLGKKFSGGPNGTPSGGTPSSTPG